jgi:hypothetical protein
LSSYAPPKRYCAIAMRLPSFIHAGCLFMLPLTGIGADVLPKLYLFFTLKTLKTGIRFKIWSLIGQYLEICVCPWEPARTFCCHFRRLFHWLIGPKLICVNDFCFLHLFCCLPLLAHSDHLCIFRVRFMVMVRMWAGSCVGVHGFLSVV